MPQPLERVKRLRIEKGIRAEDIANRLGISKSYYSMLENGHRPLKLEHAQEIARALGVTLDALFLAPPVHETGTTGDTARSA